MTCEQEMCRNWTGQGCICLVMDLEPDIADDDPDIPDEEWVTP